MHNCYAHLENAVSRQQVEIGRLMDELQMQYAKEQSAENVIVCLRKDITELNDKLNRQQSCKLRFSSQIPPIWTMAFNMKNNDPNILECDNESLVGVAKSAWPLSVSNPWFKIYIWESRICSLVVMGLTRSTQPVRIEQPNTEFYRYMGNGSVVLNGVREHIDEKWMKGDVITCGIRFGQPQRLVHSEIYFCRNDREIKNILVDLPHDGLFPTIYMQG